MRLESSRAGPKCLTLTPECIIALLTSAVKSFILESDEPKAGRRFMYEYGTRG